MFTVTCKLIKYSYSSTLLCIEVRNWK